MSWWHRFRLWRIDANRIRIESAIPLLFGPGVTVGDIAAMPPSEKHRAPEVQAQLDTIAEELTTLSEKCRRQSQSMLVPMGQEMGYRYQEALIADLLHALRTFRERLDQGRASAAIHLDHVPQPKTGAEADACDGHAPSAKEVEPT
jgi:hypothetical protein